MTSDAIGLTGFLGMAGRVMRAGFDGVQGGGLQCPSLIGVRVPSLVVLGLETLTHVLIVETAPAPVGWGGRSSLRSRGRYRGADAPRDIPAARSGAGGPGVENRGRHRA